MNQLAPTRTTAADRPHLRTSAIPTAYDEAGRLLFRTRDDAIRYAEARAVLSGSRQRVRDLRATSVPGYSWHVSAAPSAPVATELELQADELDPAELVSVEVCS